MFAAASAATGGGACRPRRIAAVGEQLTQFNVGWHVTVKVAHRNPLSLRSARAGYCCSIAALLVFFGSESLQNASADGETRTISFHHIHTKEDLTVTYKRNGRYDEEALKQINHVMRDWREQDPIKMDPHLIDLLWEVHREVGAKEPISVICGYRSPGTNAMLRRRSSGVAKFSQHMTRQGDRLPHSGRCRSRRCARPGCGASAAASASIRRRASFTWTPAACATGRECRRRSSRSVMSKGQLGSRFASDDGSVRRVAVAQAGPSRKPAFLAKLFGGGEEAHEETAAAPAATRTAAPAKPADKAAAKPAEKAGCRKSRRQRRSPPSLRLSRLHRRHPRPWPWWSRRTPPRSRPRHRSPAVATGTFEVASATSTPVRPAQAASLCGARGGESAGERATTLANRLIGDHGYWQGCRASSRARRRGSARHARRRLQLRGARAR